MKKFNYFLLSALALTVFACTIPSEIEVKGTAKSIKFQTDFEFNNVFKEMVDDSFTDVDDTEVVESSKTSTKTFIIYMPILEGTLKDKIETDFNTDGIEYTATSDEEFYNDDILAMNFSELDKYLKDMEFSGVKAKLFVSGSDIVEYFVIDVTIGSNAAVSYDGFEPNGSCNFNESAWKQLASFNGITGGEEIDLTDYINSSDGANLNVSVYVPAGTKIPVAYVTEGIYIKAELVLWIPMEFKATTNNAEVKFPDDFFAEVSDFLNSATEYIDSLRLDLLMENNPFKKGTFIMEQIGTNFKVSNVLNNSLYFYFSPEDMKKIEALGDSFNPTARIEFSQGDTLTIPREFDDIVVSLEADFSYKIEL